MRLIGLVALSLVLVAPAWGVAQEAAPAAKEPPPPPPRVEGSGEFAFVNSSGNADSTSLGIRGEVDLSTRSVADQDARRLGATGVR